ncbi:hypothetical protein CIRG_09356 [Coccidioides immitis RMSCC 2394]|uniref:Uncharacterized protein n=1 Tax=Coccidioides immitis RMSCC 2394 TaxID=404692 RepID=A0A0J6YT25_COCIT|nr:hypothetical protein CIRG_09356 [Coccidioides immitis RMSCC 2394]
MPKVLDRVIPGLQLKAMRNSQESCHCPSPDTRHSKSTCTEDDIPLLELIQEGKPAQGDPAPDPSCRPLDPQSRDSIISENGTKYEVTLFNEFVVENSFRQHSKKVIGGVKSISCLVDYQVQIDRFTLALPITLSSKLSLCYVHEGDDRFRRWNVSLLLALCKCLDRREQNAIMPARLEILGRPYIEPPRRNNLRSVLWLVPTPRKCAYLSTISAPACKHKTGDHMCSSLCRYLLLPAYCIDAPSDLAPVLITSLPSSGTKSKGCVFQDTLFLNPDRSPFDVFATVPRKRIIARSYALSAWHKKGREQEVKPKT